MILDGVELQRTAGVEKTRWRTFFANQRIIGYKALPFVTAALLVQETARKHVEQRELVHRLLLSLSLPFHLI